MRSPVTGGAVLRSSRGGRAHRGDSWRRAASTLYFSESANSAIGVLGVQLVHRKVKRRDLEGTITGFEDLPIGVVN